MKPVILFSLFLAGYSTIACAQLVEKKVLVPPQFRSVIDTNKTVMIPDEYEISVFYAGGLQRPRFMALGAKNTIYVADMNAGHILALPDADHDGVADGAYNVAPDVDSVHSLAFYKNDLYVAEPTRVRKFIDKDGDGIFESEEKFITGIGAAGPYNHYTRTILFDTIGNHIYLGVGASCNACRETDPERGTILQFNLDGSGRTIFATGLRNALGLAIDPKNNNELWTTNADRDNLGVDIPQEIISSVNQGDFFGWPLAYGAREWEDLSSPEYQAMLPITAGDSAKINQMRFADLHIPAHSTPMEILFYHDPRVYIQPPPTTMFAALHGSSPGGRKIATGYKVIKIMYDDTLEGWRASDFITGFLTDSINYTHWGRPCGLVQDSSGDIFLSSDMETPAIYRIHLKGLSGVNPHQDKLTTLSVYPNPATSSTTISYFLPKHESIKLELIDQLGRTLRILQDRNEDAGSKAISLSVKNLTVGIYYLRMQIESGILTQKVVVIQ
jgi:glucose/arabinose dehydrogenase